VLRAVRFASRYGFALDDELRAAGCSGEVRALLLSKVSRERMYKECDGCLTKHNSRPYHAFRLLLQMNLLDVVLPLASVLQAFPLAQSCAQLQQQRLGGCGADAEALGSEEIIRRTVEAWLRSASRALHWLDVLLTLTLTPSGESGIVVVESLEDVSQKELTVTAAQRSAPKHGNNVRLLFWAVVVAPLQDLVVIEKGKEVPVVPVSVILYFYFASSLLFYMYLSQLAS
jgi:tRNA nucleotidyltransferase/poly(A) polymerase